MRKNKYKLSRKDSDASMKIVAEIAVTYDMDTDKMLSTIAIRRDVEDDELVLRIGQQVEKCMVTVMPSFREHMELIDGIAKAESHAQDS
jgi:hypothetical protein